MELKIAASNFRPYQRNTLRGFVDLTLTEIGLTIRSATLHEKNDKQWIGLPAKPMFDKEGKPIMDQRTGKQQYQNIIDVSLGMRDEFQSSAIAATHRLIDQDRKPPETEDSIPF